MKTLFVTELTGISHVYLAGIFNNKEAATNSAIIMLTRESDMYHDAQVRMFTQGELLQHKPKQQRRYAQLIEPDALVTLTCHDTTYLHVAGCEAFGNAAEHLKNRLTSFMRNNFTKDVKKVIVFNQVTCDLFKDYASIVQFVSLPVACENMIIIIKEGAE